MATKRLPGQSLRLCAFNYRDRDVAVADVKKALKVHELVPESAVLDIAY